jgi:hypothetical protein
MPVLVPRSGSSLAALTPLREPAVVLAPGRLGAARLTRRSFSRSCLRRAARERWSVERERWELDGEGRGLVVYRVRAPRGDVRLVVFSQVIGEGERTDRVIAERWDVTAVLCDGELTPERLARMEAEVPRQEGGRADARSLVWMRANRSAGSFDRAVELLAAGGDLSFLADSGYVLRSTAFYANGKWGTTPFAGMSGGHPVGGSYMAQMLSAWLLREFSVDLVEHCAQARTGAPVRMPHAWRRYLGIGNATGLGMVPFPINHPRILDAWCRVRELGFAHACAAVDPAPEAVARMAGLLEHAVAYLRGHAAVPSAPFASHEDLADRLERLARLVDEYAAAGTMGGERVTRPWAALHRQAGALGVETEELVLSLLSELTPELDEELEAMLDVPDEGPRRPPPAPAALLTLLEDRYAWALAYDLEPPEATHHFWYLSASSEEPRRGARGVDPGEQVELPIDIVRQVGRVVADLRSEPGSSTARFLQRHPEHRGIVERAVRAADAPYGEVRANALARDFVPLELQRFQLAVYGAERFAPQSTDWLRVTFYQGAPTTDEIAAGEGAEWVFPVKP